MVKYFTIEWTKSAKKDLSDIANYISADNANNALKIFDKITAGVDKLNISPKLGRIVPELEKIGNLTLREIIINPWRIMYKIERDIIYILVVIDERRNVEDIILKKMLTK